MLTPMDTIVPNCIEGFSRMYYRGHDLEAIPIIAWAIDDQGVARPITAEHHMKCDVVIVASPNGIYRNLNTGDTARNLDEVREWCR